MKSTHSSHRQTSFPTAPERVPERASERSALMSERMRPAHERANAWAQRASEASSAELANEWAARANERANERMASFYPTCNHVIKKSSTNLSSLHFIASLINLPHTALPPGDTDHSAPLFFHQSKRAISGRLIPRGKMGAGIWGRHELAW